MCGGGACPAPAAGKKNGCVAGLGTKQGTGVYTMRVHVRALNGRLAL